MNPRGISNYVKLIPIARERRNRPDRVVGSEVVGWIKVIVYYVPRRIMRVITRRATMLAGDRSQGVVEA